MLKLYSQFCIIAFGVASAQPPVMKLSQGGYEPVEVSIPSIPSDKFIELTKSWALELERRSRDHGKGSDVTGVTSNTITVSAYKRNAFFYRSLGETFIHRIDYEIKIAFTDTNYTLTFRVPQIYTDSDVAVKSGLADYFKTDGTLKDGYSELDTSLNTTVNELVQSHYNFLINHQ